MSEVKNYFYLKLKENFFEGESIILLETMPDGYKYSNILLKLYLRSLKNDGKLILNNKIPYNSNMISAVTRHSIGDVEKAMKIFEQLNLVEVLDSGAIYITDIQNFIGKSTTEADRKRVYRDRIEKEKQQLIEHNGTFVQTNSTNCPDKTPPEKEKEKEIKTEKETKTKKETKKKTSSFETTILCYTSNKDLAKALNDFIEMRKAIKSPLTQRAFELMLEKLTKLSNGVDYKKIKILNNSIMSNWKGIFALKEENEERGQRGQSTSNNGQNVFKDEDLPNQIIL